MKVFTAARDQALFPQFWFYVLWRRLLQQATPHNFTICLIKWALYAWEPHVPGNHSPEEELHRKCSLVGQSLYVGPFWIGVCTRHINLIWVQVWLVFCITIFLWLPSCIYCYHCDVCILGNTLLYITTLLTVFPHTKLTWIKCHQATVTPEKTKSYRLRWTVKQAVGMNPWSLPFPACSILVKTTHPHWLSL